MKSIVFVNQKGGSGKSILAYHMAFFLSEVAEKRVLFVDGDEQANATKSLSQFRDPDLNASTLFRAEAFSVGRAEKGVTLFAGDQGLREVERSSLSDAALVELVRKQLATLADGFDYCVIDTAGANSRVANALLVASNFSILPCRIDPYSIDVATEVLKRVLFIQKRWNPALVNLGILPNEYDTQSPAQRDWLKQLMGAYQKFVFPAFVPKRSAFREASGEGVPVWSLTGTGNTVKTSARTAGKEIKAVLTMVLKKMEES